MGITPETLQPGLVLTGSSDDHEAPGCHVASCKVVGKDQDIIECKGVASDKGGGSVAAVEISVGDEEGWHPANLAGVYPEAEFTYSARMLPPAVSSSTGKQAKEAEVEVRCRAADDSGNLAATVSRHFPI